MSQYCLNHGKYSCQYGWDPPLEYFFLIIFNQARDEDDGTGIVFSNLELENPAMSVKQIANKLEEFGIPVPADLKTKLELDSRREVSKKAPEMWAFINQYTERY